jgi:hypothetical protein
METTSPVNFSWPTLVKEGGAQLEQRVSFIEGYLRELYRALTNESADRVQDLMLVRDTALAPLTTVSVKTGTYTITDADGVIVCDSAAGFTVNLPKATGTGDRYTVKNINSGTIVIDGDGVETIDAGGTLNLAQWDSATVQDYVSGKWIIVSHKT